MNNLFNDKQSLMARKYHLNQNYGVEQACKKHFSVFLIEDDEDDLMFSKRALEDCERVEDIHSFYTAEDVFQKMEEYGYFKESVQNKSGIPIILMDIHMPKMSGIEMLEHLKSHPTTDEIPVVLLSNDTSGQKIHDAYRLRAHSYLEKPLELNKFNIILDNILLGQNEFQSKSTHYA